MTLKELNDMARQYGISEHSELWIQPLLKDKPRKTTTMTVEAGRITLQARTVATPTAGRKHR